MKQFALLCTLLFCFLDGSSQNKNLDSLKTALLKVEGKSKITTLIELSWEYRFINADTARGFGLQALALAQRDNLTNLEAEALHNIGVTHEAQGNYDEALSYESECLKLRKQIGEASKTANTLNNLGIIYDEKGDYEKALTHYYEARKIYEGLNQEDKIAMVLTNIGIVLRAQKDYKNTILCYREAISIYKKLSNRFGLAACHANLGSVYLNIPNYDSALYFSLLAAREFDDQNIRQFLPTSWANAAMAYEKMDNLRQAKEFFLKALVQFTEYGNKKELSSTNIELAKLERRLNNPTQALRYAQEGLALANQINAFEQIMQGHEALAAIKASAQDYKEAWQELQAYTSFKDSLFQQEKSKQMLEMQTKYETEKKEKELNLQKLTIQDQRINLNQNRLLIAGLVALLLFASIIFVLVRSREKMQRQHEEERKQLAHQEQLTRHIVALQEKERARFAQDLHDSFGQQLTALKFQVDKIPEQEGLAYLIAHMHEEIRNVSFALSPKVLSREGLVQAMKELSFRMNKSGHVNLTVQASGLDERISLENETTLYRVCQEWINNILKYNQASTIALQFVQHPDELVLTIEDNGFGFDSSLLENSKGNGWKNIQSRVQLMKGTVEVDTRPGAEGNMFIVTVPVAMNKTNTADFG